MNNFVSVSLASRLPCNDPLFCARSPPHLHPWPAPQAEDALGKQRAQLEHQNSALTARLAEVENEVALLRQELVRAKTDFERERQRLSLSTNEIQAVSDKEKVFAWFQF